MLGKVVVSFEFRNVICFWHCRISTGNKSTSITNFCEFHRFDDDSYRRYFMKPCA